MRCPPRSEALPAGRPAHRLATDDRGSVTVEAAIAIGTLVLVAAAAIGAVATVLASVRCVDAARELARAASRGDAERGRAVAARIAPAGARMDLRTDGDTVLVVVAAAPVGPLPIEVRGSATGTLEPGVLRAVTPPVPDSPPAGDAPAAPRQPGRPGRPGHPRQPGRPGQSGRPGRPGRRRQSGRPGEPSRSRARRGRPVTPPGTRPPEPSGGPPDVTGAASGAGAGAGRAGSGRVPRPRDRGSATVWAAITAGTLMVVALVGVDLASAVRARHVAESAADLAALTAAGHTTDGPERACAAARAVAVANGAALRECGLDGWDATVRVEVARSWTLVGRGPAEATARAGPADAETDPEGIPGGNRT